MATALVRQMVVKEMTIPNVCMVWCQRQANCGWCDKPIEVATTEVTVFYWNKGADGHRWNVKRYYHPQCWIDQGVDYLNLHPYCAGERRGPKPNLSLSKEEMDKRLHLLRKKATLEQRKRNLDPKRADYLSAVLKLEIKVLDTIQEIAPIGGVPRKWLDLI